MSVHALPLNNSELYSDNGRLRYMYWQECYTPSDALTLIADSARVLGKEPEAQLTYAQEIPASWGAAGQIAANIIDQTNGNAPHDEPAAAFDNSPMRINACHEAEGNFINALGILKTGWLARVGAALKRDPKPRACTMAVVVNEQQKPTILQKLNDSYLGERTALTLEPVKVANIVWPPGMLMHMVCDSVNPHERESRKIQVVSADSVLRLGPIRLSAFGLPANERGDFPQTGGFPAQDIRSVQLDDFKQQITRRL